MMNTIETFCPKCSKIVAANIVSENETLLIRGENIEYDAEIAVCPDCKAQIGDSRIEESNLERAYETYRQLHNVLSPDEIRELRFSYGLPLREFSKFLGLGEQTVTKYEAGTLPSKTSQAALKMAQTADGARMLLSNNQDNLQKKSVEKIKKYIHGINASNKLNDFIPGWVLSEESSAKTGFRPYSFERLAEVASRLMQNCKSMYKTRFQKAMYFADNLAYERLGNSLTGLSYVRATYGPMMDNREYFMKSLIDDGVVVIEEVGDGELMRVGTPVNGALSDDEIAIVAEVIELVNSFERVGDLSDFSHRLETWKNTQNGSCMPYGSNFGEVEALITSR